MITSNAYLQLPGMTENATELWPLFKAMGWTEYAIAGMFGNLQTESTFNPGIWEGLNAGNTSGGYGLVQWTPATKYFNWCRDNGWTDYSNYEHQLARIQWELENHEQYYPTSKYPLSFAEFIKYTPDTSIGMTDEQCVKYLADAWLKIMNVLATRISRSVEVKRGIGIKFLLKENLNPLLNPLLPHLIHLLSLNQKMNIYTYGNGTEIFILK